MFFTFSVVFWLLLWGLIILGKLVAQATKDKVYDLEVSKLYKAFKARLEK